MAALARSRARPARPRYHQRRLAPNRRQTGRRRPMGGQCSFAIGPPTLFRAAHCDRQCLAPKDVRADAHWSPARTGVGWHSQIIVIGLARGADHGIHCDRYAPRRGVIRFRCGPTPPRAGTGRLPEEDGRRVRATGHSVRAARLPHRLPAAEPHRSASWEIAPYRPAGWPLWITGPGVLSHRCRIDGLYALSIYGCVF